jgi:dTMP kinase
MAISRFFVVGGADGRGKGKQAELLVARLVADGRSVASFDFPQYSRPSAYFVSRYLRGEYGSLAEVGPQQASLLYALDRFDVARDIRKALANGEIVVSNRFMESNMAHQGGKFDNPIARQEFFAWLYDLEFGILKIPKPDLNILLHVSAEVARGLVDKKEKRAYLKGARRDIHEEDSEHLRKSESVYDTLERQFPNEFTLVECMDGDRLLTPEEVHELVWQKVRPLLP